MTRRRLLATALVTGPVALLLAVGLAAGPAGCTPDNPRVQKGGECFLATDCAPGLICVPLRSGARLCSDDVSQVSGRPPPEAGVADAGDAGPNDSGPVPDAAPTDPGDAGDDV